MRRSHLAAILAVSALSSAGPVIIIGDGDRRADRAPPSSPQPEPAAPKITRADVERIAEAERRRQRKAQRQAKGMQR